MERINPFSFYEFSKQLAECAALKTGTPAQVAFWPILNAKNAMEELLKGLPIPLGVSRGKAQQLRDQIDTIMSRRFRATGSDDEPTFRFPAEEDPGMEEWELHWIRSGMREFETVFAEEMRETTMYFVPRRGIYHTPALVDEADSTFPADLQPHIPQKAKDDWKAAGRCLAFNLLSASGFHVARAVEACLEAYYQLFSGKPGQTLNGWKDYIIALEKIAATNPTPSPTKKTLAELDQMREDYRNPIVHPRVLLTEGDARMLFANGESVIIAMAQELAQAASGVQATLNLQGGAGAPIGALPPAAAQP
ncbi:HEPN domain-containing protein [Bradyrhizobium ottawaense]|uniref:HEPN domain-containing protein n=1 Tax=Bradyrhizobium ottawaense TaxID=931866 RepID=UPI003514575E